MANTTVTKVSELLLTNVTTGAKAGDIKTSDAQGFSEVMNNAKDTSAKVQPQDDSKTTRTVVETPKSKEIKTEDKVNRDPITNETDKAEFTEEVAKEAETIASKIKEVLEVSDEELTDAMETLGLTAIDLLDPVSIKDICMELTGTADSISLITNADLYDNVKEIAGMAEQAVTDITAQFGTDTETVFKDESIIDAVNETFSDLKNKSEAPELQPNEAVVPTEGKIENIQMPTQDKDVETKDATASTVKVNTETNETAGTEAKTVTVEVKGTPEAKPAQEPKAEAKEVTTDDPLARTSVGTTETFKATVKSEESNLKGNNEGFEHASKFAQAEATAAAPQQTTVETTVNNLGEVIETVTHYSNADANSIMSQVTESIRVNYSVDTTSMELQLHPASLGTVTMHIASTNGVVTAHILVENEAVKAALESQLITLQQTFDEQGQRVEAVEVSVANYDLNKGNSSEAGTDQQKQNSTAGRVGTRRRINLNDLDEEALEDLSEDDQIAADMMARSGNSVDYTA